MAVYTEVTDDDLSAFLARYDAGSLVGYKGIAEGVENTNYLVQTSKARFILTLYEKRVAPQDLPFFLGLMEHVADRGVSCPRPVHAKDGTILSELAGRTAALVTFLDGFSVKKPRADHCLKLGRALAEFHLATADFPQQRQNALGETGWRPLFEKFRARSRRDRPRPAIPHPRRTAAARRLLAESAALAASSTPISSPTTSSSSATTSPASSTSTSPATMRSPTTSPSASTPGASSRITPSTSRRAARCLKATTASANSTRASAAPCRSSPAAPLSASCSPARMIG